MDFRPHIMTWTPIESATEPGTGYEIPGVPGNPIAVLCRFYLGGIKEFRNEDNSVIRQKGRIRLDAGSHMPKVGEPVKVYETEPITIGGNILVVGGQQVQVSSIVHFEGRIMDVFRGQLSWRCDV